MLQLTWKVTKMVQKDPNPGIWVTFEVAQKSWKLPKKSTIAFWGSEWPKWVQIELEWTWGVKLPSLEGLNCLFWTWGPKLPTGSFWDSWKKTENFALNEPNDLKLNKDGPEGSLHLWEVSKLCLRLFWSQKTWKFDMKFWKNGQKLVFFGQKRVVFCGPGAPNDHIWGTWHPFTLQGTFI